MIELFESAISTLIRPKDGEGFSLFDPTEQVEENSTDDVGVAKALNAAFLICLAGKKHPEFERANGFICCMANSSQWSDVARFYINGKNLIYQELESVSKHDPSLADRFKNLSDWISRKESSNNMEETYERIWSVFFPEATGILTNEEERVETLRAKRTVTITQMNATPIIDPLRQILFTSNVLLSVPLASKPLGELIVNDDLKDTLVETMTEPQLYWYDHPIQIGVEPEKNEVIYGLRGLDEAVEFERARGNLSGDDKLTCVLSVSVTHDRLHRIAKTYLKEELAHSGGLKNLKVYAFTESDTQRILNEILVPAAERYLQRDHLKESMGMFGVDGKYGRHYSFLKAFAAYWNILIAPEIKATFKIDMDQVFPQKELVGQTGASAFEHLRTPLWGAYGIDSKGNPVEMGMIAGALVNENDIGKSLFTPDVPFPNRTLSPDEYIFFSVLPQALSTRAEIMTRYTTAKQDGKRTCIQRIHVTGGTNGILINSLRRYRPFTPSFINRAEDQAYILSVLSRPGRKLAYLHKDGLIMRHDKKSFAQEAIRSAHVSTIVGDYSRILRFSAYAKVLTDNVAKLKDTVDPFTGSFISRIPTIIVHLRFCLKAASYFAADRDKQGLEFITNGVQRLTSALDFTQGKKSLLKQEYDNERLGWDLYYDTLSAIEDALKKGDWFAARLQEKAQSIIDECLICFTRD